LPGALCLSLIIVENIPTWGGLAIDKGSAVVVGSRVFKSGILERGITMSIKSFMSIVFTCTAAATFVAGTALAADPAVKCESGKLKEASKYSSCRLKADSKAVKKDEAADYAKCEAKFADKWAKAETKAGVGICPSEGDQVSMDARITTDVAEVATLLAGGTVTDCSAELSTCTGSLSTCTGGLSTCTGSLSTCNGDLTNCNTDLGTAQGSLSTCNGDLTNCNNVLVPAAFEDGEEAGCVAGGGTWAAGTSTCTAASNYNCFLGGFCARVALTFPPGPDGYTNVFDGDTQGAGAALAAGCDGGPGAFLWEDGLVSATHQIAAEGLLCCDTDLGCVSSGLCFMCQ